MSDPISDFIGPNNNDICDVLCFLFTQQKLHNRIVTSEDFSNALRTAFHRLADGPSKEIRFTFYSVSVCALEIVSLVHCTQQTLKAFSSKTHTHADLQVVHVFHIDSVAPSGTRFSEIDSNLSLCHCDATY